MDFGKRLRGFDARTVAEVFGLPENIIPVMMFAMGYPSEKAKPKEAILPDRTNRSNDFAFRGISCNPPPAGFSPDIPERKKGKAGGL